MQGDDIGADLKHPTDGPEREFIRPYPVPIQKRAIDPAQIDNGPPRTGGQQAQMLARNPFGGQNHVVFGRTSHLQHRLIEGHVVGRAVGTLDEEVVASGRFVDGLGDERVLRGRAFHNPRGHPREGKDRAPQDIGRLLPIFKAGFGVFGEQPLQQSIYQGGHIRPPFAGGLGHVPPNVGGQRFGQRFKLEGGVIGDEFVEDGAEGVEVGTAV